MFALSPEAFTRERKLGILNTVGSVIHMMIHGNEAGYSITAQNFFSEMKSEKAPPNKQSLSEARSKLSFEAFKFLLEEAYRPDLGSTWHGYRVQIADGTKLNLPRTEDILKYCEPASSKAGACYYPQALMVTVIDASSGQPIGMEIGNHRDSERKLMLRCLENLSEERDLWLLDRGLGGAQVYFEFLKKSRDFIHRVKTSGTAPLYLQEFLKSKKASQIVSIVFKDDDGTTIAFPIRLVRGPKDSEGKRIVFATSLLDEETISPASIRELYRSRWNIETLYGRMKNLLNLEKFHARSWNGCLQEIYANLLVLSLTSLLEMEASLQLKVNRTQATASFKAVVHVVRRNLVGILGCTPLTEVEAQALFEKTVQEAMQVIHRKRPGRRHPRVSMQPIKIWNLCKKRKLAAFYEGKSA